MRSSLPDFPWDALAPYGDKARAHPGGIIDLSVGTPVDPTPEFIQTALRDASNSPSYPVTAGTPELRAAITAWAKSRLGATGDFDVLPVIGSKELVAWLPTILESKKVLIPEIAYPTYHVGALIAQAQSVPVPISAQSWPQGDLAWMNSPSNPTGSVYTSAQAKAIAEWAVANNIWIISDEIYEHLLYDGATAPSLPVLVPALADTCIIINGVAKTYAMTGWRVGWMIGPKDVIKAATNLQSHLSSNVSNISQRAAIAALTGDLTAVQEMGVAFNRRRKLIVDLINEIPGFVCPVPQGAFYVYPSVKGVLGKTIRGKTPTTSAELATLILEEVEVAAVPGEAFGPSGYLRFSYATSDEDIVEGIGRIKKLLTEG